MAILIILIVGALLFNVIVVVLQKRTPQRQFIPERRFDDGVSSQFRLRCPGRLMIVWTVGWFCSVSGMTNGLYCVIDLSGGGKAASFPMTYFDGVPKSGWGKEHKTNKLVLRRIEPGKFKFLGRYDVRISKPFYLGIFEVTRQQYHLVTGKEMGRTNVDRPAFDISWESIRGGIAEDGVNGNWPVSNYIDPNSFMGKLAQKVGNRFDLPTEAQWEYACRAGTTTFYHYGVESSYSSLYVADRHRHPPVGSKLPNSWGLYDMYGYVLEWCLDQVQSTEGGRKCPLLLEGTCRRPKIPKGRMINTTGMTGC